MEKGEVKLQAENIKTVKGLARLLSEIKESEFNVDFDPITQRQLFHFCSSSIVHNRYKTFYIHKKNGGLREINAPCYQLSIILYVLNIMLKAIYSPNEAVTGFVEGKSIIDNAERHVGHHYVFNIDLKNFFPSVSQGRVWARLQLPPFNFSDKIARVIAGLCCTQDNLQGKNVLPQGAPTSPLLINAVCDRLDKRLMGIAKRFGLHYSRYADDITFSSNHNVYHEDGEFRKELVRIIRQQGFVLNPEKTRLFKDNERQEVTGLIVNEKVNVARKYIRDLRCILHVWEKLGYGKAYSYFYKYYKQEKGYIKKGEPILENVIEGKLNYLRMIKGEDNVQYNKLKQRFNALHQFVYWDQNQNINDKFIFVYSYPLLDFEKEFKTTVNLVKSCTTHIIASCYIENKDKVLFISKSLQGKLKESLEDKTYSSDKTRQIIKDCYVNLCRRKGKNFWLITEYKFERDKCLSIQNVNLDINLLLSVWEQKGLEEAAELFNSMLNNISFEQ